MSEHAYNFRFLKWVLNVCYKKNTKKNEFLPFTILSSCNGAHIYIYINNSHTHTHEWAFYLLGVVYCATIVLAKIKRKTLLSKWIHFIAFCTTRSHSHSSVCENGWKIKNIFFINCNFLSLSLCVLVCVQSKMFLFFLIENLYIFLALNQINFAILYFFFCILIKSNRIIIFEIEMEKNMRSLARSLVPLVKFLYNSIKLMKAKRERERKKRCIYIFNFVLF